MPPRRVRFIFANDCYRSPSPIRISTLGILTEFVRRMLQHQAALLTRASIKVANVAALNTRARDFP